MTAYSQYTGEPIVHWQETKDDRNKAQLLEVKFEGIGDLGIDYIGEILLEFEKWDVKVINIKWLVLPPVSSEYEQIKDQLKEIIEEREESYMKRWDYPTLVFDHAWTGELPF